MDRSLKLIQAYKQTPWRRQFQVIGLFSATVVFVAIVAGVYLNVTARAATFGREIQSIRRDSREIEREIEDLQSRLAILSSGRDMRKRAEELGFVSIDPNLAEYLKVPSYPEEQMIELAPELEPPEAQSAPQLPPQYTMSLFDWIREMMYKISVETGAAEVP
jgi:cell division protein FtsL